MTADNLDLLAQFARELSQETCAELVNRNLYLVCSTALGHVQPPELAKEVSRTVFTNLAPFAAKRILQLPQSRPLL